MFNFLVSVTALSKVRFGIILSTEILPVFSKKETKSQVFVNYQPTAYPSHRYHSSPGLTSNQ